MEQTKKPFPKKLIVFGSAGLAVLILLGALISIVLAPYRAIDRFEAFRNAKTAEKRLEKRIDQGNGFCEKELRTIIGILEDTAYMKNLMEKYEMEIQYLKDTTGYNYKYNHKRIKFESDFVEASSFKDTAQQFQDHADDYEHNPEYYAKKYNISEADVKKLAKAYRSIGNKLANANAKYVHVTYQNTLSGSAQKNTDLGDGGCNIFRVNGKWIHPDYFNLLGEFTYRY